MEQNPIMRQLRTKEIILFLFLFTISITPI